MNFIPPLHLIEGGSTREVLNKSWKVLVLIRTFLSQTITIDYFKIISYDICLV